jgi:hypothetical protein
VKVTARNTAVTNCHHDEPMRKNAVHPPRNMSVTTLSRAR